MGMTDHERVAAAVRHVRTAVRLVCEARGVVGAAPLGKLIEVEDDLRCVQDQLHAPPAEEDDE